MLQTMDRNGDGIVDMEDYKHWLARLGRGDAERLALLTFMSAAHANAGTTWALVQLDYFGTAMFALVGTVLAGEAGMNLIGCVLVGAIAAMGGGTMNNLLAGNTPVFWIKQPRYLALCIATATATFWLWPEVKNLYAEQIAKDIKCTRTPAGRLLVRRTDFVEWAHGDQSAAVRYLRNRVSSTAGGAMGGAEGGVEGWSGPPADISAAMLAALDVPADVDPNSGVLAEGFGAIAAAIPGMVGTGGHGSFSLPLVEHTDTAGGGSEQLFRPVDRPSNSSEARASARLLARQVAPASLHIVSVYFLPVSWPVVRLFFGRIS